MQNALSKVLDCTPISRLQLIAIITCISLNALDGFDVLAISFASPGIASEWGINRAALGVVLAMELVGMAIGSIVLGGTADKYGRKPTILCCLLLMTTGMLGAALVNQIATLLVFRFLTGLGIGGMLAATNAMVSEFANAKYRNLCVILMATGYPFGAVIGGTIASELLAIFDWRAVFYFGGAVTAVFIAVVAFCLPESPVFMANRPDKNALNKVNKLLKRMGKTPIAQLSATPARPRTSSYSQLFTPALRKITVLLIAGYFAQIMTFYFILKWIPKIVVDMGFQPSQAGFVLVWANIGGAIGAVLLGLLSSRLDLRKLLIPVFIAAFVMVCVFGIGYQSLGALALVSAATGFFTNAGVVGLYGLMARSFPAEVRASGTGVVIGIGRAGAALSPIIGGMLFNQGMSLLIVATVMGAGALVAALAIFFLSPTATSAAETAAVPSSLETKLQ